MTSAYVALAGAVASGAVSEQMIVELPGGDFSTQMYTSIQRAPGRPNDLFVARGDGNIYRVDLTTNTQSIFLDLPSTADPGNGIPDQVDVGGGYWGLLGFSFAPDFATSGNMYVHVAGDRPNSSGPGPATGIHHRIYVRRYTLTNPLSNSPTLGLPTNILRWDNHGTDHSGGWIGFQPGDNETLWISAGDGGNAEGASRDIKRTGQNPSDFLGGILRVNVSGSGSGEFGAYAIPANNPRATGDPAFAAWAPEVWSIGLRSPWGGAFDRLTGDFTIGDVGASQIGGNTGQEEVDFERADSPGARNYGWRVMEGTTVPTTQDPNDPPPNDPRFTPPVYDYPYGGGYGSGGAPTFAGRSVTGGYVYRGPVNELQGKYIFGDWSSRQIWAIEIDRNANGGIGAYVPNSRIDLSAALHRPLTGGGAGVGVTAFGEDAAGNLYYMELDGTLFKIIGDVIPELAADFDDDGRVDAADLAMWQAGFDAGDARGDADGDNDTDGDDYVLWQRDLGLGVSPNGAVPEPATGSLALVALAAWRAIRRASRRQADSLPASA
jgi:hypothetical protein